MSANEEEKVLAEKAVADLKVTSESGSSAGSTRKWKLKIGKKDRRKKNKGEDEAPKEDENPFKHLPEHEQEILKRQVEVLPVTVKVGTLYRYATRNDIIIIVISVITAIGAGAALPLMTIIFGQLTSTFSNFFYGTLGYNEFQDQLNKFVLYFLYLGIAEWITTYISMVGFMYTGEHIAAKIRENYLAGILRQNIGFFDKLGAGEITTRITSDTNLIQDGISEKVGLTLSALATFVTAFIIGFVKYWLLALILCSGIVAICVTMGLGSNAVITNSKLSLKAYAEGGTVVEEVVSSIRNATAFGTQDKLAKQYDKHLIVGEAYGFRHKAILGFFLGSLMFIIFSDYALAFWQGSRFLVRGQGGVNVGDILTILLSIMMGAFSLGNVAPNVQAFTTAMGAAAKIFDTIDRQSPLDPTDDKGKTLPGVQGNIELRNIRHIYPSRPEVVVMDGVNLLIQASKTTALVGPSGSGKSTVVGLVERFYDPVEGQVFLDGHDIRDLNLGFIRRNISLVSQEPTLFGTTIYKNIEYGLVGTEFENFDSDKKRQLVEDAARMSNAHEFITGLPEGYETHVGERGFLLSGGQKQRIAIARAVISDPKILLLDEATSALDTKSEGVVQQALDKAAEGRTTIVIAHRLSTIKDADSIVVMSEGKIIEQGTHAQLLDKEGAYYNLVEAQKFSRREISSNTEEEQDDLDEIAELEDADLGPSLSKLRSDNAEKLKLSRSESATSSVLAARKQDKPKKAVDYSLWTLIKLIASFNKEEWHLMLVGLALSIVAGLGNPVGAIFFAKCIIALSRPPFQYGILRHDINFWSGMYFLLAFSQLIAWTGNGVAFAKCSERLVHRVRDRAFRTILRQDIGFFDKEENTAGALTSFLSTEANYVAGLSGATLGTILNVLSCLIGAFALALAVGWKLALVCISTVPVLLVCGFLRFWILTKFQERAKAAYDKSAGYASENVSAIRTVASLSREKDVQEEYRSQLAAQGWKSLNSVLKSSTLFASSQSLTFLCMALAFWYGGTLLGKREYSEEQFFICFAAVIFSTQSAGTVFSFAPDMGKAKQAASDLLELFDRKPAIDTWSTDGTGVSTMRGTIRMSNVHFRYPTRPEQPVLRGLNLTVEPGQYAALVGPSGCGKSTTISLLERFYDPIKGGVFVDGEDITTFNLNEYRKHLALVSQEPTLYQGTIRENVLLGSDRPDDEVTEEQIEQACKDANIYNFIMSLPQAFDTVIGNKGVMLSGGQKQRVAIARALLRNPKILLLDEATSALDSESEKVVQAALDNAAKGRTTIAVAHRLSTIQNADCIYVFDSGRIVEKGTHSELMRRKGRYFELVELQNLEKPL